MDSKLSAVICGGGGFIGGHLAADLIAKGFKHVRVVDIKPFDQWYQVHKQAENIQADLNDKAAAFNAVKGMDVVWCLACNMGGMGFIENNKGLCMISVGLAAPSAWAQVGPVVGGGVTAFDPEISVVNSGAVLDAQAVVSADRKYVTINAIPQQSNVIQFRDFQVQGVAAATGFGGFAGGANPAGAMALLPELPVSVTLVTLDPTPNQRSDTQILNRPGIIRLSAR